MWEYERKKRFDKTGRRWHFVNHYTPDSDLPEEERPFELYFRDDEGTEFGLLRYEKKRDFPYRYEKAVEKILNDITFRKTLLDEDTQSIWRKNWK